MARLRQAEKAALCSLAVSLVLGSPGTRAGPPLITDDPGTPGDERWEINIASTVEKLRSEARFEAALLDINYGVGERTQLKYEVQRLSVEESGTASRDRLVNSEIGIKYRFLDEAQHGVSMSVYPQVSISHSGSDDQPGSGAEFVLPFQMAWSAGPVVFDMEVGYAGIEYEENEWLYGLAGAWPISKRLEFVAEVHGVSTSNFEDDVLLLNIGGVLQFHENVGLLFSVGRSIHGSGADEPELLGYLGIQLTGR